MAKLELKMACLIFLLPKAEAATPKAIKVSV